MELNFPN